MTAVGCRADACTLAAPKDTDNDLMTRNPKENMKYTAWTTLLSGEQTQPSLMATLKSI